MATFCRYASIAGRLRGPVGVSIGVIRGTPFSAKNSKVASLTDNSSLHCYRNLASCCLASRVHERWQHFSPLTWNKKHPSNIQNKSVFAHARSGKRRDIIYTWLSQLLISRPIGESTAPWLQEQRRFYSRERYDNDDDGRYEGDYRNGERHGYGTCVYFTGATYEGEWKFDLPDGHGKLTHPTGEVWEGTFVQGKPMEGSGTMMHKNGDVYVGQLQQGKRAGHGAYTWQSTGATYEGGWLHDVEHGEGSLRYPSGENFVGLFEKGLAYSGEGTLRNQPGFRHKIVTGPWKDGYLEGACVTITDERDSSVYVGGYQRSRPHGTCSIVNADGTTFRGSFNNGKVTDGEGTLLCEWGRGTSVEELQSFSVTTRWQNGMKQGKGTIMYKDKGILTCTFVDNVIDGHVILSREKGRSFEGIYVKGRKEGTGTLRMTDKSVYEGSFSKNKRNGSGRLTRSDGAIIEGNWKDDKLEGDVHITYGSGDSWVGVYKQGKPWKGEGTFKLPSGTIYVGPWKNGKCSGDPARLLTPDGSAYHGSVAVGKMHGVGILTESDGTKHIGEFSEGVKRGEGQICYPDGVAFTGYFEAGEIRYGSGTVRFRNTQYSGEWVGGRMHGQGCLVHDNGHVTEGEFRRGVFHNGRGYWRMGSANGGGWYDGEWRDGKFHGRGVRVNKKGSRYEGQYDDGERHGQGKMISSSGKVYTGPWVNGHMHGEGTLTTAQGKYVGEFVNSAMQGRGRMEYPDGSSFDGEFVNGQRHGVGKLTTKDGEVLDAAFKSDTLTHVNGQKYVG